MLQRGGLRWNGERALTDYHGRFVWYELLTTDIAAAKAFYGSVVGWGAQDASTPAFAYTIVYFRKSSRGGPHGTPGGGEKDGSDVEVGGICRRRRH